MDYGSPNQIFVWALVLDRVALREINYFYIRRGGYLFVGFSVRAGVQNMSKTYEWIFNFDQILWRGGAWGVIQGGID